MSLDGSHRRRVEAQRAREWLKEHGSPVQKMLDAETDPEKQGLYLCHTISDDGEPAIFTTRNDEMILEYVHRLNHDPVFSALIAEGKSIGSG